MRTGLLSIVCALAWAAHGCGRTAPPSRPPAEPPPRVTDVDATTPATPDQLDQLDQLDRAVDPDRIAPTEEQRRMVGHRAGHSCARWIDYDGKGTPPGDHACGFGKVCRGRPHDEIERQAFARVSWAIVDNPHVIEASPPAWVAAQRCATVTSDAAAMDDHLLGQAARWAEQERFDLLLLCAEGCTLGDDARAQLLVLEDGRFREPRMQGRLVELELALPSMTSVTELASARLRLTEIQADLEQLPPAKAEIHRAHVEEVASRIDALAEPLQRAERQRASKRVRTRLREVKLHLAGLDDALKSRRSHRYRAHLGTFSDETLSGWSATIESMFLEAQSSLDYARSLGVDVSAAERELDGLGRSADAAARRVQKRRDQLDSVSAIARELCSLAPEGTPPHGPDRARWNHLSQQIKAAGFTPPRANECYVK